MFVYCKKNMELKITEFQVIMRMIIRMRIHFT